MAAIKFEEALAAIVRQGMAYEPGEYGAFPVFGELFAQNKVNKPVTAINKTDVVRNNVVLSAINPTDAAPTVDPLADSGNVIPMPFFAEKAVVRYSLKTLYDKFMAGEVEALAEAVSVVKQAFYTTFEEMSVQLITTGAINLTGYSQTIATINNLTASGAWDTSAFENDILQAVTLLADAGYKRPVLIVSPTGLSLIKRNPDIQVQLSTDIGTTAYLKGRLFYSLGEIPVIVENEKKWNGTTQSDIWPAPDTAAVVALDAVKGVFGLNEVGEGNYDDFGVKIVERPVQPFGVEITVQSRFLPVLGDNGSVVIANIDAV